MVNPASTNMNSSAIVHNEISGQKVSSGSSSICNLKNALLTTLGLAAIGSVALYFREKTLWSQADDALTKLDCVSFWQTRNHMLFPPADEGAYSYEKCYTNYLGAGKISLVEFCKMDSNSQQAKINELSLQKISDFNYCERFKALENPQNNPKEYLDILLKIETLYDLVKDNQARLRLLSKEELKSIKLNELSNFSWNEISIISARLSPFGYEEEALSNRNPHDLSVFEFYKLSASSINEVIGKMPLDVLCLFSWNQRKASQLDLSQLSSQKLNTLFRDHSSLFQGFFSAEQLNKILPRLSSEALEKGTSSKMIPKFDLSQLSTNQLDGLLQISNFIINAEIFQSLTIEQLNTILPYLSEKALGKMMSVVAENKIKQLDLSKLYSYQLDTLLQIDSFNHYPIFQCLTIEQLNTILPCLSEKALGKIMPAVAENTIKQLDLSKLYSYQLDALLQINEATKYQSKEYFKSLTEHQQKTIQPYLSKTAQEILSL